MPLRDLFASKKVRRMAREEAAYALRVKGDEALDHLRLRATRSEDPKRKQVYRIAAAVLPKLTRED